MNYLFAHWQGNLSIARAGWLSSIIAIILDTLAAMPETGAFFADNKVCLNDLTTCMMNGDIANLKDPPASLAALHVTFGTLLAVWWCVGMWRSCTSPENNPEGQRPWFWARFGVVLTALFQLGDIVDFCTTYF
jgi:hypothetical protein